VHFNVACSTSCRAQHIYTTFVKHAIPSACISNENNSTVLHYTTPDQQQLTVRAMKRHQLCLTGAAVHFGHRVQEKQTEQKC
jgi:hypothetical protein